MKKRILTVAAIIIGSQLLAQTDSSKSLDEVILTSNKYPKKQTETGKVVTVISREQLEKNSGRTLAEMLNMTAGTVIQGANSNGGTNLTANIRGASAGNVLILVDGVPVNDPSAITNYFDLNFLPVEQVERIEILKGGQSTLYGSDAVAGVIHIITKKPGADKLQAEAGASAGSYGTFRQHLGLGGRMKQFNYTLGYTHYQSKGFSAAHDVTGMGDFDRDGHDQHAVNMNIGYQASDKLQFSLLGSWTYYQADLDAAAYTDEKDFTVQNDNLRLGIGMQYRHKRGTLRSHYQFNYLERYYYDDSLHKSNAYTDWSEARYMGRTHFGELYSNWKWGAWELLAGADIRYHQTDQFYIFQSPPFVPGLPPTLFETSIRGRDMHHISPYASLVYLHKGWNMELGGRWNRHSEYGSHFTYTLNPSLLIREKLKIFANLYSAFKAPTLYQLFDGYAGNPDLGPEKGTIAETGLAWYFRKNIRARAVGFYRHTRDAIIFTYNPATYESRYLNLSVQENYGAEFEFRAAWGKWSIDANYTYTDGRIKGQHDADGVNTGKDTSYNNLYRIPKHAANLSLGWQACKALYLGTSLRVVGERQEYLFGAAPQNIDGYAVWDLYAEYKWGRHWKLYVDLKNITDREYFDFPGYNTRKFNMVAGLGFRL